METFASLDMLEPYHTMPIDPNFFLFSEEDSVFGSESHGAPFQLWDNAFLPQVTPLIQSYESWSEPDSSVQPDFLPNDDDTDFPSLGILSPPFNNLQSSDQVALANSMYPIWENGTMHYIPYGHRLNNSSLHGLQKNGTIKKRGRGKAADNYYAFINGDYKGNKRASGFDDIGFHTGKVRLPMNERMHELYPEMAPNFGELKLTGLEGLPAKLRRSKVKGNSNQQTINREVTGNGLSHPSKNWPGKFHKSNEFPIMVHPENTVQPNSTKTSTVKKGFHESPSSGVHYQHANHQWVATWTTETGESAGRSFCSKTYGFEEARQMAIECRKLVVDNEQPEGSLLEKGKEWHMTGIRFDRIQQRWVSTYYTGGKRKFRYFPLKEYGYDGAQQKAIEWKLNCDERMMSEDAVDSKHYRACNGLYGVNKGDNQNTIDSCVVRAEPSNDNDAVLSESFIHDSSGKFDSTLLTYGAAQNMMQPKLAMKFYNATPTIEEAGAMYIDRRILPEYKNGVCLEADKANRQGNECSGYLNGRKQDPNQLYCQQYEPKFEDGTFEHTGTSKHIRGVTFDKKNQRWGARWNAPDGRRAGKYFPVSQYGYEVARQLAVRCRSEALKRDVSSSQKYQRKVEPEYWEKAIMKNAAAMEKPERTIGEHTAEEHMEENQSRDHGIAAAQPQQLIHSEEALYESDPKCVGSSSTESLAEDAYGPYVTLDTPQSEPDANSPNEEIGGSRTSAFRDEHSYVNNSCTKVYHPKYN